MENLLEKVSKGDNKDIQLSEKECVTCPEKDKKTTESLDLGPTPTPPPRVPECSDGKYILVPTGCEYDGIVIIMI